MPRLSVLCSALFAAFASAQLIPTTLPACAQQCTTLIAAQNSCASNPAAEASCFCQNANLASIRSAPSNNLCTDWCSPDDWATIATWYNSQACPNGQVGSIGGSTMVSVVTVTTTPASGPSTSNALAATSSASSTSGSSDAAATDSSGSTISSSQTNASDYKNGSEWWSTHYQWIIMVIVLLVVFLILGIGGHFLFRRYQRRQNVGGVSGSADWAPNSNAHDFDTQGRQALATAGPVTDEKRSNSRKGKFLSRR